MFVQNGDEMKIIFFPKKVVISVRREIGSQKKESLFLILISRLEKGGDQKE
jgi:c-di-GMP-binding flagellar brake protein YcgR